MSKDEIIQTAVSLLTAGSETTSTALSGATYYLTQNPQALRQLQNEVRDKFSRPEEISIGSTVGLPYLIAVIEESLRMYPPVSTRVPRRTGSQGAYIHNTYIPPNVSKQISLHTLDVANYALDVCWSTPFSNLHVSNKLS